MKNSMDILFREFLETEHTGKLADLQEKMNRISAALEEQIEAGSVNLGTAGDYELAATEYGFYGGLAVAWDLMQSLRKDN